MCTSTPPDFRRRWPSPRRILAGDPETKEGYFRFLKGGCSRTPVELLKLVGLDMEEPEVVNEAVKVFEGLLDEMEELA